MHHDHPIAVGPRPVRRQRQPRVGHAQRLEDLLRHEVVERAPVDATDHLAEHVEPGDGVIAGPLARHPTVLQRRGVDRFEQRRRIEPPDEHLPAIRPAAGTRRCG